MKTTIVIDPTTPITMEAAAMTVYEYLVGLEKAPPSRFVDHPSGDLLFGKDVIGTMRLELNAGEIAYYRQKKRGLGRYAEKNAGKDVGATVMQWHKGRFIDEAECEAMKGKRSRPAEKVMQWQNGRFVDVEK